MHPIREYFNASAARISHDAMSGSVTGHSGDTGSNREDIIVDWVNRHTPSRFKCVLGGRVLGLKQAMSSQIDCMVISDIVPRFELHKRSICVVESLAMAISIKSKLDKHQLFESLNNLSSIPRVSGEVIAETSSIKRSGFYDNLINVAPSLVIWAYDGINPDTLLLHLNQWLIDNQSVPKNRLPISIIVNEKYIIQRSLVPSVLSDGTPIPADTWHSSYIGWYPGCGLSTIIVNLSNTISLLNDLKINFYHYANEALDDANEALDAQP